MAVSMAFGGIASGSLEIEAAEMGVGLHMPESRARWRSGVAARAGSRSAAAPVCHAATCASGSGPSARAALMLEEHFPGEVLEIPIMHPALAYAFVGKSAPKIDPYSIASSVSFLQSIRSQIILSKRVQMGFCRT